MGSRTVKIGADDLNKTVNGMPSFVSSMPTANNSMGAEGSSIPSSRISDLRTLEQTLGFHIEDVDLTRNPLYNQIKSNSSTLNNNIQFGSLIKPLASTDVNLPTAVMGSQTLPLQKESNPNLVSTSGGPRENWGESNMADTSTRTDTSTDDTDDKSQRLDKDQGNSPAVYDSSNKSKEKTADQKTLRRLAQNREAARKSRLRKKAYVQQLESSRLKLTQLEQELQRARQQGIFISNSGDQAHSMSGNVIELSYSLFIMLNITEEKNALCCLVFVNINSSFSGKERDHKGFLMACRAVAYNGLGPIGCPCILGFLGALAFDVEYSRWLEEHNRLMNELRAAVNSHAGDTELRTIVDNVTTQFDDIFRLKGIAAKADVFHILSGMWKTPAERCFLWIGGFRSSEILKTSTLVEKQPHSNLQPCLLMQLLVNQLEPLAEQQLMGICNLQQLSQQAEDALSQGMDALQQSLAETLASATPATSGSSGNVANYMGQMAMAMGKLGTLEGFLRQADNLRQQTLQQMHRILTTRQSARALLAINDYFSRLRALSSLWLARPRD
uniref:Transcription factor HBP-1b(C38)-like n=1 Tax=Cucumis melo TaxID=3656 RepID=A0A9I9CX05_CUCME